MDKLNRMVSIDLNTPSPSLVTGIYNSKHTGPVPKQRTTGINSSDAHIRANIYEKYFKKRIAKPVSFIQLFFAVVILVSQLSTTGLLIGPAITSPGSALSTSDRIGLGIWTSVVTTLSLGATLWALNKPNFCRLHASMLLHSVSLVAYIIFEYLLLTSTIPNIQTRLYFLQGTLVEDAPLDGRRQLLSSRDLSQNRDPEVNNAQIQIRAELHRLYAALVLSILMALSGIFQLLLHLLMTGKTGRAICLAKSYLEAKLTNVSGWVHSRGNTLELPKLERSDALPPPPYESGYFHPSLNS